MAVDRRRLRDTPGVRFAKMLGTGTGTGFGPADADLTRWAALVVWDDPAAAAGFDETRVARSWRRISTAAARIDLRPVASRGTWSGAEPFAPAGGRPTGPVLALTRARLRPRRALTFWRSVPPVVAALHRAPGLVATFGVGEAPVGWQGTVSVWRSAADLVGVRVPSAGAPRGHRPNRTDRVVRGGAVRPVRGARGHRRSARAGLV